MRTNEAVFPIKLNKRTLCHCAQRTPRKILWTMECPRTIPRPARIAVVLAIAVASLIALIGESRTDLIAAPHTIRQIAHPFDPDWPDVQVILTSKCCGCHRPGSKRAALSDYESLMAAKYMETEPVVVPGDPDESPLWQMVAWNAEARIDAELPDHPEMPPDHSEWLSKGQLDTIHRWIANGALQFKLPSTCSTRPLLEIDFPSARACKVCHPKQYEERSRSMHHYAQHSPIFEAFNLTLIERTGGTIGTFCSRCHTPLGTALGESGSRRNVNRSRLAMEGVTCVVCHRQRQPYYKSNARQHIEAGGVFDTCMYGPFDDPTTDATQSHPAVGNLYLKSSAFCGSCHDVTSPVGVRLEEAFSEWQNSPAARQGITCQQCHMGPVQGIPVPDEERPLGRAAVVPGVDPEQIPLRPLSDHTFAGPDYSLLPDTEFPKKLDWMYETDYRQYDALTPYQQKTLQDLRRRNRHQLRIASHKRYELLRNAACINVSMPSSARCSEEIKVCVDVTSKVSGHSFPTGFTAERQAWVQITVSDPAGRIVFQSGDLDSNGDLRHAHSYAVESGKVPRDRYLLNFQNEFVALTQKGTERSIVLSVNRHLTPVNVLRPATGIPASFGQPSAFRLARGALPPLATIGRTYPVRLPPPSGQYVVDVRLNFRHLPPTLLDHIGTPHLKHLLEIVVIDQYQGVITVGQ